MQQYKNGLRILLRLVFSFLFLFSFLNVYAKVKIGAIENKLSFAQKRIEQMQNQVRIKIVYLPENLETKVEVTPRKLTEDPDYEFKINDDYYAQYYLPGFLRH